MGKSDVLAAVRAALGGKRDVEELPAWNAPPRPSIPDLVDRFREELIRVNGDLVDARGKNWTKALERIIEETGTVALFLGPDLDVEDLEVPAVDLSAAEVEPGKVLGVARATAGIAASGTVVIGDDGAQLPSLVTDNSVVVLSAKTLVPYLTDLAPPPRDARQRMLVTGPSRTADIEKILVLGAHGPKRLFVIVVA